MAKGWGTFTMFELLDWINQIRVDLPAHEKRALEDAEDHKLGQERGK